MIFMVLCHDKPDSLQLRMDTRAAHLDYLAGAGDRVKVGGPILSPGGDPKPIGSMILIDAASEAAVKLFAENDPYAKAGLFQEVEIRHWRPVVGDWTPNE